MPTSRHTAALNVLAAALLAASIGGAHASPQAAPASSAKAPKTEIRHYHMQPFTPDPGIAEYRIPLFMLKGHPVVIAHLPDSSEPLYFVVDTAAQQSIIDRQVAQRFKLHTQVESAHGLKGAGGDGPSVGIVQARHLTIGKLDLTMDMISMDTKLNTDTAGLTNTSLAGIIGQNVLGAYHTTFDLGRGELLLRTSPDSTERCVANLDLKGKKTGFTLVDVTLPGGDKARAVIDTGAAQTVFNWPAAKAMGVQPDDARLRKRDKGTRGIDNKAVETWLYDVPGMQWNDWKMHAHEVRITDLPVFATLGLAEQSALIFGIDFLKERRFTIEKGTAAFCLREKTD